MAGKMYGISIRLPAEDKGQPGMNIARATIITEKLVNTFDNTIAEIAAKSSNYLIKHRIRIHLDSRSLKCDLIGELVEQITALEWINGQQNHVLFKKNAEEAIHTALDRWCRGEYEAIIWCDQARVWFTDEAARELSRT